MKNLLLLSLFSLGLSNANAQSTTQEKTQTTATSSTGQQPIDATKKETAGAGNALVNPSATEDQKSKVQKIPDGTYGSNRTGQIYSPSNPNYPYDQSGKLIRSKNTKIVKASKKQSSPNIKSAAVSPAPAK